MGWITTSRRRQIRTKGRQMILEHSGIKVPLLAYAPPPTAADIQSGVAQASFVAEIQADEVQVAGITPAASMEIVDGSKFYTLTDAIPIYDRQTICGWRLIAAGGQ
ncbi:hypothetical protein ACI01nite_25040 [Acetobacter cibinongensis]|uniref:Phage protein n=1 Tax=Acetobacter cibinongensis TaxID=146475 RepID=A0A0D6N7R5_9PROT|nr:hypothetical protein [Acetobacter cibinongensis]GAN61603.1 hypothetical protein Abci_046_036 [Acetobacter cibinongensis]GBQ17621.1 hypothetical protein AA0482_1961 [Acetobacter cibinongensis NRIC 0482]GEL59902.1 hypothetical protein ACI01nite_25040 [Acetobacter cibinongensis]